MLPIKTGKLTLVKSDFYKDPKMMGKYLLFLFIHIYAQKESAIAISPLLIKARGIKLELMYIPELGDMEHYHLVDMNTSILLVENQAILNRISLKISSSAHSRQKRARRSVHDAFGMHVYQRRSLKWVIWSHITCLITVIWKILI